MLKTLISLFLSSHPMPSLAVTTFALLYGVSAGLGFEQLVLVAFAVLAQQFSVGLSNDWLDYSRDKQVARQDKPLAKGELSPKVVRNVAFMFVLISLLIAFAMGFVNGIVMTAMLAAGWSYNLGLKAGMFSVVPYVIGFGILPSFVTVAATEPYFPEAWVFVVASLLGVSAHFANALPDLIDDRETGINALPHLLGSRASGLVISVTAVAASGIVVWQSTELFWLFGVIGMTLTVLLAIFAALLARKYPPPRLLFPVLLAISLINVILFMLA